MNPRFVELAADPSLIPGIYNYCDQWCTYCPHTERCLAYKCLRDQEQRRPGDIFEDLAASVNEMISFSRDVVQAEGGDTPLAEIASLQPIGASLDPPVIDDPLERRGREYAMETARFLMSVAPSFPPPGTGRAGGTPAAIEVVVWYHALIAVKIYRALASAAMSQQDKPGLADDAQGSAKVALIRHGPLAKGAAAASGQASRQPDRSPVAPARAPHGRSGAAVPGRARVHQAWVG